jgi:hypothetical protein
MQEISQKTNLEEYHVVFHSTFRNLQTDGTDTNATTNGTGTDTTSSNSTTTVTSNPLTSIPLFMGFFYAAITGMVAIYALVFFMYKRREDRDPNLLVPPSGLYQKMYALIIRVFPLFMKLAHYAIFVMILIQVANVLFIEKCNDPYSLDTFGVKKDSPINDFAQWSLLIYAWFWVTFL